MRPPTPESKTPTGRRRTSSAATVIAAESGTLGSGQRPAASGQADEGQPYLPSPTESIAPGKAIAVFGAASGIPAGLANAVGASTGQLNLANGGDTVILKNSSGTTVDSFAYPSSLAASDGVSMNRSPDASTGSFVLHNTLSSLLSSAAKRVNGTAF